MRLLGAATRMLFTRRVFVNFKMIKLNYDEDWLGKYYVEVRWLITKYQKNTCIANVLICVLKFNMTHVFTPVKHN